MHLIVDGYDCRSELLSDRLALLRWLNGLPAQLGMSVLLPATVARIECPRCKPGDEGLSGFVIICESHIAVHTWPARGEIQADVYSCRPFDPEPLLARIVADFGIGSCDTKLIERRRVSGNEELGMQAGCGVEGSATHRRRGRRGEGVQNGQLYMSYMSYESYKQFFGKPQKEIDQ
jgi:S-adenosylmethionine decarboxylase